MKSPNDPSQADPRWYGVTFTERQEEIFLAHAKPKTYNLSYMKMAEHFYIVHSTLQGHVSEIRRILQDAGFKVSRRSALTYLAYEYLEFLNGGERYEK